MISVFCFVFISVHVCSIQHLIYLSVSFADANGCTQRTCHFVCEFIFVLFFATDLKSRFFIFKSFIILKKCCLHLLFTLCIFFVSKCCLFMYHNGREYLKFHNHVWERFVCRNLFMRQDQLRHYNLKVNIKFLDNQLLIKLCILVIRWTYANQTESVGLSHNSIVERIITLCSFNQSNYVFVQMATPGRLLRRQDDTRRRSRPALAVIPNSTSIIISPGTWQYY